MIGTMERNLRHALDAALWARDVLDWSPDATQERLLQSDSRRVLLNCTRQWGKSTTTAVALLHELVFSPRSLSVLLSPTQRQSAEAVRKVEEFAALADEPTRSDGDNACSLVLRNGSRLVGLPGTDGTIRGFSGVSFLVVDEASRVTDAAYKAARPMVATVPLARLWLLSTPFGKRGFFWDEWQRASDWHVLTVKASDCPRISAEFLSQERRAQGDWWFRQEYCCEFVDTNDQVFSHQTIMQAVTEDEQPWNL